MRVATSVGATRGRLRVNAATTVKLNDDSTHTPDATIDCDAVLMSGGWTPSVHLFSQSRGRLVWDDERQAYVPGESAQRERSAGACRGLVALDGIIEDGYAAGEGAARAAGGQSVERRKAQIDNAQSYAGGVLGKISATADSGGSKSYVDFQNDVTVRDVELAVREGFRSIEHVKRYTTTGMATDQGKTSNLHALAIVAGITGKTIPEVGLTSFRQPYTPVTFGTFAGPARGALFDPLRCPPSHGWATEHGALFEDVGSWRRARSFCREGEDLEAALARECATVRNSVGLFDASTLGKIEVVGPDAVKFLERIYVNRLQRLEAGRCRYALLLNDAGFVIDDGVIARLAHDRFHVTTTTGGAASVLHRMEDFLQTEWPNLDVWLTSTTEQWATLAVQGPQARAVLEGCIRRRRPGVPLPCHTMGVIERELHGVPARISASALPANWVSRSTFRTVSGTHCGWHSNARQPLSVAASTAPMPCTCCGRKRLCDRGQETDGTVTPDDLGLGRMVGNRQTGLPG